MRRQRIKADSVAYRHETFGTKRDIQLLENCQTLWANLDYFRKRRARSIRFAYGDQWGDLITVKGETTTQRAYITRQGNVALQSNQIKKIVNTITGVWTKEQNEPIAQARATEEQQYSELMTTTLQANWQRNKMKILMINALEDAILGGACFMRESYDIRGGDSDCWTDICNPNYIFFDSGMKDPRVGDLSLIGEIHDITFNEFCAKFCTSAEDFEQARKWYTTEASIIKSPVLRDITRSNEENIVDFYSPYDNTKCRVFEIWTKEVRPMYRVHDPDSGELYKIKATDRVAVARINAENRSRLETGRKLGWSDDEIPLIKTQWFMESYWYCRYLTPQGYIVWEGESPFEDMMHPYSICVMPFTDGKIVSYVSDAIDHNIAINRALTLDDWLKRSGAKGVTFIAKDLVPDDMSYEEFAEQWTSVDGIIYYQPKAGVPQPQQFYGHTGQLNTTDMVKLLSDLMESSIAVSGALQGKTPYSGTSAALYAQQTQNSSTPLATLLARFESFTEDVATRKLKMIRQFYDTRRYEMIAGKLDPGILDNVNISDAGKIEYDLAIVQSTETPVYRMVANDQLLEFWRSGAIMLRDALELSSLPYKDKLIQKIDAREAQAQAQAQAQGQIPAQMPVANQQ